MKKCIYFNFNSCNFRDTVQILLQKYVPHPTLLKLNFERKIRGSRSLFKSCRKTAENSLINIFFEKVPFYRYTKTTLCDHATRKLKVEVAIKEKDCL